VWTALLSITNDQSWTLSLIQSAETESYKQQQQQQRKYGLIVDTFGDRNSGATLCKVPQA